MSISAGKSGMVCLTALTLLAISSCGALLKSADALEGQGTASLPLAYWGQDINGDDLFDLLWANVSFTATVQGAFRFDLRLNDSSNSTQIAHIVNDTYLLPDAHIVSMLIDGCYFNSTWKFNGPYVASVKIFNALGSLLSWVSETSPPYLASDFEQPPATASKPYGDTGIDLDVPPDGQFNQFRISVSVDFIEPGPYMLSVFISSPFPPFFPVASTMKSVEAKAGIATYEFALSGTSIRSAGFNGPYAENVCVWAMPDPGQMVKTSFSSNDSLPYLATDFQERSVVQVTGTVVDHSGSPISGATVAFVNYTDLSYNRTMTNMLGGYSENLHMGDYICLVTRQGRTADNITRVTVTGAGPYDFTLSSPPASVYEASVVMTEKDSIDWRVNESLGGALTSTKMMIDWDFSDMDGYVSYEESSIYARTVRDPPLVDDSDESLRVDGIIYYPNVYASNVYESNYTGPVLSRTPIEVKKSVHLSSNREIPRQINHLIEVNVSYDRQDREGRMTLRLPPRWIASGYSTVANVTVGGVGTDTVLIDPMGNPNPSGKPDYVWVDIGAVNTILVPPTVLGQEASPSPQEYMQPVHLSAWISDSSPISNVNVSVTAPTSGFLGSFPMLYDGTSKMFSYDLTNYPDLGTYSYTVWASDTDGNSVSAIRTFTVRDTTAPVADGGPDKTVYLNAPVTLEGGGSEDNFGISNWTWTFNDSAGTVTLYGRTATHAFATAGTYPIHLSVTDYSGNVGTDDLVVVVVNGGDVGRFADIPTDWVRSVMVLSGLSFILAGALALVFGRWNRILRHPPLGSIGAGLTVLAASFAFAAGFMAILASGPSSLARPLLLANFTTQTLAIALIAAGYGLWKYDRRAVWTMILLMSLLILICALIAFCVLAPATMAKLNIMMTMSLLSAVNLTLLSFVTVKTLRSLIMRPQNGAVAVPMAFGALSLGQFSLLIWNLDGGIASIVLGSAIAVFGLVLLLGVALFSRRSADG